VSDVRTKVRRLIELAVGTANEHEARNAAVLACRLIKEHNLLEARGFSASEHVAGHPIHPSWVKLDVDDDFFEAFKDILRDRRSYPGAEGEEEAPPPPQPSVVSDSKKKVAKDPDKKNIPITMPAWCAGCGQLLKRGSYATWSRGEVWHQPCFEQATEGP
jgi:hypothetical protein